MQRFLFLFTTFSFLANGKLAIDDRHPCANDDHCTCVEWLIFMYIQIGSTHVIIVVVRDLRSIYSHYLSERQLLLLLLDEHFLLHRYDQTLHFIDQSMIIVSLDRSSSIDRASILELATFPGLASLESRPNIPPMFS